MPASPSTGGRTGFRVVRWAAAALAAAVFAVACGDDGTATTGSSGRSDEEIIAFAVLQVGSDEVQLAPDTLRDHLVVLFQVNGRLSRDESECAADVYLDQLGDVATSGELSLIDVLSADTRPDRRAAVAECVPATVGPEAPRDPFAESSPEPMPDDLDPSALRRHLVTLTAAVAESLGMTPSEAECFGEEAYGGLDDRQIVATLEPASAPDVQLPERTGVEEIRACLDADRIRTLATELRPLLDAFAQGTSEDGETNATPGG